MARYDAVFARGNLRRRFGFHTDPLTLGIETSPGRAKAPVGVAGLSARAGTKSGGSPSGGKLGTGWKS